MVNRLIAADALNETHTTQILVGPDGYTGQPGYYGLGWNVSYDQNHQPILGHSGAFFIGAGTAVRFSPSDQLGIVALTNAQPAGLAEAITFTLLDLYRYGKSTQDWLSSSRDHFRKVIEDSNNAITNYSALIPPPSPVPSRHFSSYVGTYSNAYHRKIEITEEHGWYER